MIFNHSKLLGKIRECGFTQETLAESIKINVSTLNAKLNNKNRFTTSEIQNICRLLNIANEEIGLYFFAE